MTRDSNFSFFFSSLLRTAVPVLRRIQNVRRLPMPRVPKSSHSGGQEAPSVQHHHTIVGPGTCQRRWFIFCAFLCRIRRGQPAVVRRHRGRLHFASRHVPLLDQPLVSRTGAQYAPGGRRKVQQQRGRRWHLKSASLLHKTTLNYFCFYFFHLHYQSWKA